MLKDTNLLKSEAAEAANRLGNQVSELEVAVQDRINEIRRLSPLEQIKEHPLPAVGIAALAGFLITFPKTNPLRGKMEEEVKVLRSLAIAVVLEKLSKKLADSSPEISSTLEQLRGRVLEKTA